MAFFSRYKYTYFLSDNSPTFPWQGMILLISTSQHSNWLRLAEIKYMFPPYLIIICHFTATITSYLAHTGKSTGARLVPLNWTSSYILAAQLNKGIVMQKESLSLRFTQKKSQTNASEPGSSVLSTQHLLPQALLLPVTVSAEWTSGLTWRVLWPDSLLW